MASVLPQATAVVASQPSATRRFVVAAVALAFIAIIAAHFATASSIVAIWQRSDTFAHGFLVVPICLWLGWKLRAKLAVADVRPWWPGLLLVAAAGLLGYVAALAEALGPRQFALAFTLQATVVTVAGLAVARTLAFPLAFLLFAVPTGEILLPTLIDRTADFTVFALRASGIPVYREANRFVIPSGSWSVVEACSGLRYLVASLMVGSLYAWLSYRSAWRRAAFVAASIAVPLVANWLRAYLIVLIAHLTDNRLAVGVDHLIYGWLFFGVVIGLLFWVGSLWAEPSEPSARHGSLPRLPANASRGSFAAAAIACVVVAALAPLLSATPRAEPGPVVASLVLPAAGADGWQRSAKRTPAEWVPGYKAPVAVQRHAYVRGGDVVGVHVAWYTRQGSGRELVTSGNTIASAGWRIVDERSQPLALAGHEVSANRARIVGPDGPLIVWYAWWVDGAFTTSTTEAKLRLAWGRLRGAGDDGALVAVFAREEERRDVARDAFVALSPSIAESLEAARGTR